MSESMFGLTREYKYLLEMLEEESDDETVKAVISDTLELLEGDIEADIPAIRAHLSANSEAEFSWAHLGERSEYLSIR